jgi:hypothetical protein
MAATAAAAAAASTSAPAAARAPRELHSRSPPPGLDATAARAASGRFRERLARSLHVDAAAVVELPAPGWCVVAHVDSKAAAALTTEVESTLGTQPMLDKCIAFASSSSWLLLLCFF